MGLDADTLRYLIGRVAIERAIRRTGALYEPGDFVTSTIAVSVHATCKNLDVLKAAIVQDDEDTEDNALIQMRALVDDTFLAMKL